MFKLAKYYLLLNWFQKIKRNISGFMVSVMLFVPSVYLFSDLIAMAESKSGLVLVKWVVLLLLLGFMSFNLFKIFNAIRIPFLDDTEEKTVNLRRDKIILKVHLRTKSERILHKYRENR